MTCGLQSTGPVVVVNGLSRSKARRILPDQGSSPCPPCWQQDSLLLSHQGSLPLTPGVSHCLSSLGWGGAEEGPWPALALMAHPPCSSFLTRIQALKVSPPSPDPVEAEDSLPSPPPRGTSPEPHPRNPTPGLFLRMTQALLTSAPNVYFTNPNGFVPSLQSSSKQA